MNQNNLARIVAALYCSLVIVGWTWNLWCLLLFPIVFWAVAKAFNVLGAMFGNRYFKLRDPMRSLDVAKCALHSGVIFVVVLFVFLAWRTITQGWAFHMDDTFLLWEQACTGNYTNWHPALYTLLFFAVPRIFCGSMNGAIVMHLVALSLGIACVSYALLREGFLRKVVYGLAFVLSCNPFVLIQSLKTYKDSAFAALVLMVVACVIRIVYSRGKWIGSSWNILLTGLLMSIALIMRHNGFFYIVPLSFLLCFFYFSWKRTILLFCIMASVVVIVYGPVYKGCLKIPEESSEAAHRHLFFESCGMPLSIMGAIYQSHMDELPKKNCKWLESIVAKENWKKTFNGCFQSVKWDKYFTPHAPAWLNFFNDFIVLASKDPQLSWMTFLRITSQAWNPFGSVDYSRSVEVSSRAIRKNRLLGQVLRSILYVHFNCVTGFTVLALVILLGVFAGRNGSLTLVVPILCYNLGTMLLLTGNDSRFFFYSVFVAPVVVLLILTGPNEDDMANERT